MVVHPTLLIVLPLVGAFSVSLIRRYGGGAIKLYGSAYLFLNLIISAVLFMEVRSGGEVTERIAGYSPPVGIFLAVGAVNAVLVLLINLFAAFNYLTFNPKDKEPFHRFTVLYLLGVASSSGIVLTGDLFNMFVFFEIAAVSSYALVASSKDERSVGSAIKYMILGSVGSTFMLISIALIYSELRTLNLYDIAHRIGEMGGAVRTAAFTFLIVGIGVEAEIFPFNGWVPGVYGRSDGNISSFLVLGPSKAAIYAILRVLITLFYGSSSRAVMMDIAMVLGLITLVVGEVAALSEKDPKRMLAFSSIGQMGLILIAISLGSAAGIVAAVFLMVSHASVKSALFLSSDVYRQGGMRYTLTGALSVGAVLGLVGMPPFAGFWGKWYLLSGAADEGLWIVIAAVIFTTAVEAYYLARFLSRGLSMKKRGGVKPTRVITMTVMVGVSLLVGLFASVIYEMVSAGVTTLLSGGI
ncbi:MAG: hypothetical protein J7L88_01860 [Thermoplasmata archaeon]|nr:hypothetical protein [Thermoplasmata archaeon]